MQILVLRFLAFAISLWGVSMIDAAQPTAAVALRDGLLLLLIGSVLFAASLWPPLARKSSRASARGMARLCGVDVWPGAAIRQRGRWSALVCRG